MVNNRDRDDDREGRNDRGLSEHDIRWMVRRVLEEERREQEELMDEPATKTIAVILKGFGIDEKEEEDIKEDFRYLRKWRKGSERVTGLTLTALVTLLVGGMASAFYLGVRTLMGRP